MLSLIGARAQATDLRAGAALILVALAAQGESEITGLHHIDRGYVDIADKLRAVGANIERIEQPNFQVANVLYHQSESI